MRWPWSRRPKPPEIPPFEPRPPIQIVERPKEPDVIVEEIDTSAMTQTGVHRAWKRLIGKGE